MGGSVNSVGSCENFRRRKWRAKCDSLRDDFPVFAGSSMKQESSMIT